MDFVAEIPFLPHFVGVFMLVFIVRKMMTTWLRPLDAHKVNVDMKNIPKLEILYKRYQGRYTDVHKKFVDLMDFTETKLDIPRGYFKEQFGVFLDEADKLVDDN